MKKNNFFNLIVRKNITSETMLAYVAESFVFIFMVIYEHLFCQWFMMILKEASQTLKISLK